MIKIRARLFVIALGLSLVGYGCGSEADQPLKEPPKEGAESHTADDEKINPTGESVCQARQTRIPCITAPQ